MRDYTELSFWAAVIVLVMAVPLISLYVTIRSQQRTIDRLNDRLMARDLREYVNTTSPKTVDEKAKRKRLSWYDDGDDDEEEKKDVQ